MQAAAEEAELATIKGKGKAVKGKDRRNIARGIDHALTSMEKDFESMEAVEGTYAIAAARLQHAHCRRRVSGALRAHRPAPHPIASYRAASRRTASRRYGH